MELKPQGRVLMEARYFLERSGECFFYSYMFSRTDGSSAVVFLLGDFIIIFGLVWVLVC